MRASGVVVLLLAVVIGILPQFTTCESEGKHLTLANGMPAPMRCTWTAQAEIGAAIPLGITGVGMMLSRRRETKRMLSLLAITLGTVTILLPTALIGVCQNMSARCNLIMQPSLILLGVVAIVASLLGLVLSERRPEAAV